MQIQIDNTGLHSVARTLRSESKNDLDVKGLIQLSSLIIFSDKIHLAGLEDKSVFDYSNAILTELESLGVNEDIIQIDSFDEVLLKTKCKETADQCAIDLASSFNLEDIDLFGMRPDNLAKNSHEENVSFLDLIQNDYNEKEFADLAQEFISTRMDGAIHYMFAVSPTLRQSLKAIVSSNPEVSTNQLHQIGVYLRFHLNENIAKAKGQKFTPAVGRSQFVRKSRNVLMNRIAKIVDDSVADYTKTSLPNPSLVKYLVLNSKGNHQRMIEYAMRAREKAAPLRKYLRKIMDKYDFENRTDVFDFIEETEELRNSLLIELGLKPRPKLRDSFELSISLLPTLTIKNQELQSWIKYKHTRKKIVLLTEISKEAILDELEIEKADFQKLL